MGVIPLTDASRRPTRMPVVTASIIAANAFVFILELLGGDAFVTKWSLAPANIVAGKDWITILTSMFMHGGWFHLLGNMWFLWVFGNNIEDSMGHTRFVVFYLLSGVAAAATQVLVSPHSVVPMVGASGAISGVMGAYILLYPRVRVHTLVTLGFFVTTVALPAYVMLGYWFVLQLLMGAVGSVSRVEGGVAVWAHVGGFVAGMALIKLFANRDYLERRRGGVVILPRDA